MPGAGATRMIEHRKLSPLGLKRRHPLLLLHGAWHGAWCWDNWLSYFASVGYQVHAISLPGHGASPRAKRFQNFYRFKDYVCVLTEAYARISPAPIVIGHSLGGAIVQKFLQTHRPPGAVLVAPLPLGGFLPLVWRRLRRYPLGTVWSLLRLDGYSWVATPELSHELFFSEAADVDPRDWQRRLVRESFAVAAELAFPPVYARPELVQTPMLVVAGGKDAVFPIAEVKHLAQAYRADWAQFDDQGHNLMADSRWHEVADRIDDWIAAID